VVVVEGLGHISSRHRERGRVCLLTHRNDEARSPWSLRRFWIPEIPRVMCWANAAMSILRAHVDGNSGSVSVQFRTPLSATV